MKFYLGNINEERKEDIILNWEKTLPLLSHTGYKKYFNRRNEKGALKVVYFNTKFSKLLLNSTRKLLNNPPVKKTFLRGFIDGIIATEGYAEIKKKRIVISQNKGPIADLICHALKKLNIRFFVVLNKKKKLLIRITRKGSVMRVVNFCDISSDKLYKFTTLKKWRTTATRYSTMIKVLSLIQKNKSVSRQDLINKLQIKNPNCLFYSRNSPLHKYKLVRKIGKPCRLMLTYYGIKLLEKINENSI